MWGLRLLRFLVSVLPASEKLFSDFALDAHTHRVERATRAIIGNK